MAIYYFLFMLAVALGLFIRNRPMRKLAYVIVMGAALFALSAVRYDTGYDYNLYAGWYYYDFIFKSVEELAASRIEKGFLLPMKYLADVIYDYQAMFVVIAFVVAALVMLYIYKYSSNVWISVAAFLGFGVYFNSMNFMRQLIAALLVTFALRYIQSRQPLRYLILILFASTLHFTALVMLPFYFLLRIRMNYAVLSAYAGIAVLTYWKSTEIMELVTSRFYTYYDPSQSAEMTHGLPIGYFIGFAALFAAAFALRKPLIGLRKFNGILINCAFFTMLFEFYGTKHTVISRFALLFYLGPVLLLVSDIAKVLAAMARKRFAKRQLIGTVSVYAAVAVCMLGFYGYLLSKNYNGVVPYQSIFDKGASASLGAEGSYD